MNGDTIQVVTKDETIEGIEMPSEDENSVVVKMKTGYNVGIDKKKITKIKVLEKYKESKSQQSKEIPVDKNKKTISILHTGGTIASKVDYQTGGVIARFSPQELIGMFPELKKIANIKSRLISNMFSEDMRFAHYAAMAKAIKEEIDAGCDGIILTHGTDTMTYTSAALSFMLENVPVPVIITGAQRSSDRGSSDAAINIIASARFIVEGKFCGVGICMHGSMNDDTCLILPGTKTKKLHSSRRDAFKVVNGSPIASVSVDGKVTMNVEGCGAPKGDFVIHNKMEEKVAILRVHPNMHSDQFLMYTDYKGLVIEGTGLGHCPIVPSNELAKENEKNADALKKVINGGVFVGMTSQTVFGRVHPHVYSSAINLEKMGCMYSEDMLTETAFIKLAWLLGNFPDQVKELYSKDLRGEINSRIQPDEFLEYNV